MKSSVKSFVFLRALISPTILSCLITGIFQEPKLNKYPPFETKGDEDKKRGSYVKIVQNRSRNTFAGNNTLFIMTQ